MVVVDGWSLPRKSEKSVKIGKNQPINRPSIQRGEVRWVHCEPLGPVTRPRLCENASAASKRTSRGANRISPPPCGPPSRAATRLLVVSSDFSRVLPIFPTFLGDFDLRQLSSGRLQTLREWKNRVLLEEYYIVNVAIPLEVEHLLFHMNTYFITP